MTKDRTLEKAIEKMDGRTGRSFSDQFCDFMEMALGMLCNNPNDHQRRLLQKTFADKARQGAFLEALNAYGDAAEGYHDPLGDMFMMRISHGQNGQFFTPDSVCEFMAAVLDPQGETLNDPCCGSGRLLLAGLKVARESGNDPIIYANDLSYTCAHMCLMNLLYNGARGEVSCGNSLLMDLANFRFYHIDRVLMPNGAWMSTYWQYTIEGVEEVNRQRDEWRARMIENGIPVEILPDPLSRESVPEVSETVQDEAESVPKEQMYDRLTARPKAVQLELNLF